MSAEPQTTGGGERPPASAVGLTVGLTGGLASGKSTVARRLAEAGFTVVDADRLVAELYQPGAAGAAAVRDLFGDSVLTTDGAVDHAALAAIVFADDDARQRLETAIHPLVRRAFAEIARRTTARGGIAVLEATLLVEADYRPDFDLIITVEAAPENRLARAIERGLAPEAAAARLAAQGTGEERRQAADRVITNDGSLDELHAQVDALVEDIRALALSSHRFRYETP